MSANVRYGPKADIHQHKLGSPTGEDRDDLTKKFDSFARCFGCLRRYTGDVATWSCERGLDRRFARFDSGPICLAVRATLVSAKACRSEPPRRSHLSGRYAVADLSNQK